MKRSNHSLEVLIAGCRAGWSLPGAFYTDEAVYRLDIERIWRRGWLFAGHTCEIPEPGDYFTVEVDTDSVIILRGDDGVIRPGPYDAGVERPASLGGYSEGRLLGDALRDAHLLHYPGG